MFRENVRHAVHGLVVLPILLAGIAYKNRTSARQPMTLSSFSAGFRVKSEAAKRIVRS